MCTLRRAAAATLTLLVLGGAHAQAQTEAASPSPGAQPHWWSGLLLSTGASYNNQMVTLGPPNRRALFESSGNTAFEGFHLRISGDDESFLTYYYEANTFHLTRQKLLERKENGEYESVPSQVDLGTEIRGQYALAGLEIAGRGKKADGVRNSGGFGLGVGLVNIDGSARYAKNLKEDKLDRESKPVHTGIVAGVSLHLFLERMYFGSRWGWPQALHGLRFRLEGGVLPFTVGGADVSPEYLRLLADIVFQL